MSGSALEPATRRVSQTRQLPTFDHLEGLLR
jgi:hypothetical protein